MTTTPTTPTAAQLAALAPRELDALAHETVFRLPVEWLHAYENYDCGGWLISGDSEDGLQPCSMPDILHEYSASLDAAALLEAELTRRELSYIDDLLNVIDPALNVLDWADSDQLMRIATASAKSRTIACILAAQESPYVQIVTWNKHPKDSANSNSTEEMK